MVMRVVLWVVVVLGATVIITASVLTAREKAKSEAAAKEPPDIHEDDEDCCGDEEDIVIRPAVEMLGHADAPVKVVGFVPDCPKHNGVIGMLRRLAGDHVDEVHVTLRSQGTVDAQEEMDKLGHEGAGFFVDGRKRFTLRDADGTRRKVVFEGDPDGDYEVGDLRAVIERAMADAAGRREEPHGGESGVE